MPPGNPGGLGEPTYLNIVAFLLESNGARAGNQALTAANKVAIRTVASRPARAPGRRRQWRRQQQAGPWAAEPKLPCLPLPEA